MLPPDTAERNPAPAGPRSVWVLGTYDREAYRDWVCVPFCAPLTLTCARTGTKLVVRGFTHLFELPATGKPSLWEPCVRAEYVRHSKGLVLARLADGRELWVKIVALWQFADRNPPVAVFPPADRGAA